jgi:dTDP-4-amino-4,6-dideoxygalactose transaminase
MPQHNQYKIPLHRPFWGREEEKAAVRAMRSGTGVGDLSYSDALAYLLSDKTSAKFVLPTGSGTAALELACMCLLKKGDEVIVPSFTFSSTVNAIMLSGAKPIFADIDTTTFNLDPLAAEEKITKKTRAIMVVHYAGMAANMEAFLKLAKKYNLFIIEDAAQALGAKYKGKHLGTLGKEGCYSFHGTKNTASGEGGAFLTNDLKVYRTAEIIREKGTNRSSYMRGERQRYSWVEVGRSLILSDILSAIALVQISKLENITSMRQKNATYFLETLRKISANLILPKVSEGTEPNWHIFAIRVPKSNRNRVIRDLRSYGIEASFHFLPLHTSEMGKKMGYKKGDFPITEEVSSTLIRLPMYPQLKRSEMDYIASVLEKVL